MAKLLMTGAAAAALVLIASAPTVRAASYRQLGFSELVQTATLIVHGKVVATESYYTNPGALRNAAGKESVSPARPGEAGEPSAAATPPQEVGVRGGNMIMTRVTFEVIDRYKGEPPRVLQFQVAGGRVGDRVARVAGLPEFLAEREYVLFLRPGFEGAGDPVLGVNQGFFPVVNDDDGQAVMLTADFDYLVAIDGDRLTMRHNPAAATLGARADRPMPQLAPAPTANVDPEHPVPEPPTLSPEVKEAYAAYMSSASPMTLNDFATAIRTRLGR